jgi:hypothetical protein
MSSCVAEFVRMGQGLARSTPYPPGHDAPQVSRLVGRAGSRWDCPLRRCDGRWAHVERAARCHEQQSALERDGPRDSVGCSRIAGIRRSVLIDVLRATGCRIVCRCCGDPVETQGSSAPAGEHRRRDAKPRAGGRRGPSTRRRRGRRGACAQHVSVASPPATPPRSARARSRPLRRPHRFDSRRQLRFPRARVNMNPYVPRPKPTWVDWIVVAVTVIVALGAIWALFSPVGPWMATPG